MRRSLLLPLALAASCFLKDDLKITYDLEAQKFATPDFGNQPGMVPDVSCAADPLLCAQVPAPPDTMAVCDTGLGKCVVQADIRLVQTINLSQERSFPSQVANSSVIDHVEVNQVRYWTPTNTLTFTTPPIELYIGGQTTQRETDPGATRLATVPPIMAKTLTACRGGTPGTLDGACLLDLTADGKNILGRLAKDYRTPFNVIVYAHVVARPGDPMPGGKMEVIFQPQLAFVLFK